MEDDIKYLLEKLETLEFSAEINVCSDLRSVEKAIFSSDIVHNIIKLCQTKPEKILTEIMDRTQYLVSILVDPRYESPWDIALVAHLVIINSVYPDWGFSIASIISKAKQTWWAASLSKNFLTNRKSRTETAVVRKKLDQNNFLEKNWLTMAEKQLYQKDKETSDSLIIADTILLHRGWRPFWGDVNLKPNFETKNISPEIKDKFSRFSVSIGTSATGKSDSRQEGCEVALQ